MKVKAQIISQDDIKVKFEIVATVGQLREIINDIPERHCRSTSMLMSSFRSASIEVSRIFHATEEGEGND